MILIRDSNIIAISYGYHFGQETTNFDIFYIEYDLNTLTHSNEINVSGVINDT